MTRTCRSIISSLLGTCVLSLTMIPTVLLAQGVVALTGARIFDGTGAAPIERGTVLIRGDRIEAVGAEGAVSIPSGATRVDLSGKTILPGLINAHGHLNDGWSSTRRDRLLEQLRVYADYGVTTVFVLGAGDGDLEESVKLRREQDTGSLDRARLYVAGPTLQNLKTAAEARERVNRYADAGADLVKIHITGSPDDMTPAVYGALIEQAHTRGLPVAAHMFYLRDARGLVDAGVDVLAHSVRDQDVDAALIAEIKRRNVGYIPTLTRDLARFVYESTPSFYRDPFFLAHGDPAFRADMLALVDPVRQAEIRNDAARQADKASLEQGKRNLKILSDAGVTIALGTDSGTNQGQWQGYFEHVELELMVESGMTPRQVLIAATSGAARAMDVEDELGTLAPGKRADLLVLDENPLENIRATRAINSVWIAGERLSREQ